MFWKLMVICAAGIGVAGAGTIAAVDDAADVGGVVLNGEVFSVSWTMPFDATNVVITGSFYKETVNNTLNAYLSNTVGAGAVTLQSSTQTLPNYTKANITLLSGLTLSAGTYYLTITGTQGVWGQSGTPTSTTAPGVTINPGGFANGGFGAPNFADPPQTTFAPTTDNFLFTVTGDAVPEPQTWTLMGIGLVALTAAARWKAFMATDSQ